MAPAIVAGGSARLPRLSPPTGLARHPEVAQALALWWISGGVMGQLTLGNVYCVPSIRAAWKDDMAVVADLSDWAEVIEKNPSNRQRILDQDRYEFIATMERWMMAYCPAGRSAGSRPARRPDPAAHHRSLDRVPQRRERPESPAPPRPKRWPTSCRTRTLVEPPWGDRELARAAGPPPPDRRHLRGLAAPCPAAPRMGRRGPDLRRAGFRRFLLGLNPPPHSASRR